jgi:hypothetical protein
MIKPALVDSQKTTPKIHYTWYPTAAPLLEVSLLVHKFHEYCIVARI